MNKKSFVVILFLLGFSVLTLNCAETADTNDLKASASKFMDLIGKGDYKNAAGGFDAKMKEALPPDKLKKAFKPFGILKKQHGPKILVSDNNITTVLVNCEFDKGKYGVKIVFNRENEISGLWFDNYKEVIADYLLPEYAKPDTYTESEIAIGSGNFPVHGTLTMPAGTGPFPAVILVHGSGPNDRDETLLACKPFKDLAVGLASQGVAVIRYEKRTKEYPEQFTKASTVKEEVIDDVLEAVSTLKAAKNIKSNEIFVLGHSLGGMLFPRIGMADSSIAGFISMAGSTRHLEDALIDQTSYYIYLDGKLTKDENAQLKQIRELAEKIKDPELSEPVLGVPAQYWLDLREYNPPEMAKKLSQPILILQGERDCQVTVVDFQNWKDALSNKKNVKFILYPKLNHAFISGEGKSIPSEYEVPGHVAENVVEDIATWVKAQ